MVWFGLCLSFLYAPRSESRPIPSQQNSLSADGLLEAGERALRSKDYRRAKETFEAAYLQNPQPAVLCRLAALADAQGLQVAARDLVQRCRQQVPESANPDFQQLAQRLLAQHTAPSGLLSFLSPKGGFLWIDERLTARLPADERLTLQVAAGRHALRLMLPGSATSQSTEIDMKPDERLNARCDARGISVLSPFSVLLILHDEAGALWQRPEQVERAWQAVDLAISQESGALLPLARMQQLSTQAPKLYACRGQPACQMALGQQVGATHVLAIKTQHGLEVKPGAAADYQLSSTLVDMRVELQSNAGQAFCERCTEGALLLRLAELAKPTFRDGLRPKGWLEIRAPHAEISVDGSPRGQTYFRHAMFLGTHQVTIVRPYFQSVTAELKVEQEETTPFAPTLVPLPSSRGERTARIGRWVFGGVGLTMIAIGAGLLVQEDTYPVPLHSEEFLNKVSTQVPGIALLAGGGAALGISVALFVADAYYTKKRR